MFDSRAGHIGDGGDRVFQLFDWEAIFREKVFWNTVLLEMTSKPDSLMPSRHPVFLFAIWAWINVISYNLRSGILSLLNPVLMITCASCASVLFYGHFTIM